MDTQRIIALVVFSASSLFLWEAWQKHNRPPAPPTAPVTAQAGSSVPNTVATVPTIPSGANGTGAAVANVAPAQNVAATSEAPKSAQRISVQTDTLQVELDTQGGDVRKVTLLKHPARGDANHAFSLMQDKVGAYFIAQSGLLGHELPTHAALWKATATSFDLGSNEKLNVILTNNDVAGISVSKTYMFKRGSYVVDIRYDIKNDSGAAVSPRAYFQFLRDGNPPEGESAGSNPFTGIATFTGPAVYTEAKKFQKVSFTDIDKSKQDHVKESTDGWLGMVQHYFVSAWLPQGDGERKFFTQKYTTLYSAGVSVPISTIASGAEGSLTMPLYIGPQEQDKLNKLAPGLGLVVDYGWLKVLAYPMFVVLSWIHGILGNWGWTIILFTILLKVVFFPLNQKAGKSMAHMKTMTPKMEALKARYGDDKMKLNQAMMEMYKTEKINPLGGCLPIVVQMPFFISLYWVLLSAVELRNAPWIGWITDLSTPDPFYVLPIIMGASMIIQTKLNPAPADPVQAKVMMVLPVVFSIMFFFFPSGLVLYWTMQNILGIAQQWYINKTFGVLDAAKVAKR